MNALHPRKLFSHSDWSDVVRESRFAQTMKARYPRHFVDCVGMGSAPDDGQIFAVFERATGMSLAAAATRFHVPEGMGHVSQALDILDQLLTIMLDMMKPDSQGALHQFICRFWEGREWFMEGWHFQETFVVPCVQDAFVSVETLACV